MKAAEITLNKQGFNFSANVRPAGSNYKHVMGLGRVFPTTKPQARYFVSEQINLDVLNMDDVEFIEKELSPYGFIGEYKYTTKGKWVRLINVSDMHKALRLKYSF